MDSSPETKSTGSRKLPNNLTVHKLNSRGNQLLLLGVQPDNLEHTLFVRDLLDRLQIENCASQLPPDSPFLIKTQRSFREAWRQFIGGRDYSFFMNNSPNYLHEATLQRQKIDAVRANIFNSKEYASGIAYGMSYNEDTRAFEPNAFLQPFFSSYLKRLVFCDYPALKEREYQASTMSLKDLRKLFLQYIDRFNDDKLGKFDPRLLHYEQMLRPKIDHMAGVLKLTSRLAHRTLAVCESQYTEFVAESWKKPEVERSVFQYAECQNKGQFVEFIEKLVILDLILEPLVSKYFIGYRSFPFNTTKTVGGTELINSLFVVWDYYYHKYRQAKYPHEPHDEEKPLADTDDLGDKYSPFPKAGDT